MSAKESTFQIPPRRGDDSNLTALNTIVELTARLIVHFSIPVFVDDRFWVVYWTNPAARHLYERLLKLEKAFMERIGLERG